MRQRKIILVVLLSILYLTTALPEGSEPDQAKQDASQEDSTSPIENHDVSPSIRKCMLIKCAAGYYCIHGECKKVDYLCIDKKCQEGFRCNHGECVKQKYDPKKQICKPLGFEQEKLSCGQEQQKRCLAKNQGPKVCGYFSNGKFKDYSNQCEACQPHSSVRYYFQTSCQWAPRVCLEEEECMNGGCIKLFKESVFKNFRSCNQNKDCKINERCGGHKCIDKRIMFNYLQSKAETDNIAILI